MLAILFVSDALLLFRLLNEHESSDVYVTFDESMVIIRPLPTKKVYVACPAVNIGTPRYGFYACVTFSPITVPASVMSRQSNDTSAFFRSFPSLPPHGNLLQQGDQERNCDWGE